MSERTDIAIIGGGVVGSAVAAFLKYFNGFKGSVTVLEPDPTYARASTALSASGIRQQFDTPLNIALSQYGVDFLRRLPELAGPDAELTPHNLLENGYLFLASDDSRADRLRHAHALQARAGAEVALLTPDQLALRFPHLRTDDLALASLGLSAEGWFDNMSLLNNLRRLSRAAGAEYRAESVTGIERDGPRLTALLLSSGARLACGRAVLAAGPRSGEVAAFAGLSVPVTPRKRTVFAFDAADPPAGPLPLMIDPTGVYCRPEGRGFIAGAPPVEDPDVNPDDFDPRHEEFEEIVWPTLAHRAPVFERLKLRGMWAGHYDWNALDQNAFLGPHPELPDLVLACGFSGHGLQHAPGVGRGIAELILHGGWRSLDLSPLSVERLVENRPLTEGAVV
ncbi:MAG: NAD(P)/FAD-dependent oxidoreductase [Pseudomonadota bacterium]